MVLKKKKKRFPMNVIPLSAIIKIISKKFKFLIRHLLMHNDISQHFSIIRNSATPVSASLTCALKGLSAFIYTGSDTAYFVSPWIYKKSQ